MPAVLRERGLSLIEVMVALVILVIGLIGIFNLHIVAKRASFESFQQTQAAYLANDILNRMRLNHAQIAGYAGNYGSLGSNETAPLSCDGAGASCSPGQMRVWDLYQWRWLFSGASEIGNARNLGGLDAAVGCISVVNNNIVVAIAWKAIQDTAGTSQNTNSCGDDLGTRRRLYVLSSVVTQE